MQENDFLKNYQLTGNELEILIFPHPTLSKKSLEITEFKQEELEPLIKDMLYTMYMAPGIGLAAPQVGKNIRLFVVDVDYDREKKLLPNGEEGYEYSNFNPRIFINPQLTVIDPDITICKEGCLSVPEIYEEVERPAKVSVTYQNIRGEICTEDADEMLSTCIQHENDHLDGIVFLDHLSLIKKNILKKKLINKKKRSSSLK